MGIALIVLFILLALSVPMAFAIGLMAVFGLYFSTDISLTVAPQRMFTMLDSFSLLAIPFFVLAGNFMDRGGISKKIINFASTLVGHIKGGLAMVSVVASMIFGAISGSGAAASAAIGSIVIPSMKEEGYPEEFAAAITSVSGPLGIVIPPSVVMVIYATTANVSIGDLFLAGYIPGLLLGGGLMLMIYILAIKNDYPSGERSTFSEFLYALKDAVWALIMILIIMGGILGGFFTATEAAVVAVVYALLVGLFIYKELNIKDIPDIIFESGLTTGSIMFCVATTNILAWVLTNQHIPEKITTALLSLTTNKYILLLLINIILLVLGMFLDSTPAIILIVPILLPVIMEIGIDPIHFGMITTVNLAIGMSTPPVGLTMFVSSGVSGVPIADMIKPTLPLWISMFIVQILISVIPQISLLLPSFL